MLLANTTSTFQVQHVQSQTDLSLLKLKISVFTCHKKLCFQKHDIPGSPNWERYILPESCVGLCDDNVALAATVGGVAVVDCLLVGIPHTTDASGHSSSPL